MPPSAFDPPEHIPDLASLTPAEAAAVISASGWYGVADGLPSGEVNAELEPYKARGLYPDPGIYSSMNRRNPVIASGLAKMEYSVASLDWRILPPPNTTDREKTETDFVRNCFVSVQGGFQAFVGRTFASNTQFGFSLFEVVYEIEESTGLWRLEDLLYVPPWCVKKWVIHEPTGLLSGALLTDESGDEKFLPRWKMFHTARRFFGRNYEGESAFRPLYYHDEAMRRIFVSDQIIRERAGEGTLVLTYPTTYTDIGELEDIGEQWEAGSTAHVVLPEEIGWKWDFGGQPPQNEQAIRVHSNMISRMLEDNLSELGISKFGARAVGEEMRTVSQRVVSGMLAGPCADINQQLIQPLYDLNGWDVTRSCYAHVSGFEEENRLQTILNWAIAQSPEEGRALLPLTDEMRAKLLRTMDLE